MSNLRLHDPIALRQSHPDHNLVEGQIGCIRKIFSPDEFEVEFKDGSGLTIAILRLNLQQVRLLRQETILTEQEFWKLIENAKANSNGDGVRQVEILVDHFAQRPIPDIYEFDRIFHKFHNMIDRLTLLLACIIINEGQCTDDIFVDFRAWLIAQGEKVFHDALRDPESLVDVVEVKKENHGFNAVLDYMNTVALRAYIKKTGQEWITFCSVPTLPPAEWWDGEYDEDTLHELYPKLTAKFAPWWAGSS
jgi:hypothetical protein